MLGLHRYVDVPLDEDVEDGEGEVSHELPHLPGQQHPQDAARGVNPDPAPAHRHLGRVVADLAQGHGCDGDGQRDAPAATRAGGKEIRFLGVKQYFHKGSIVQSLMGRSVSKTQN